MTLEVHAAPGHVAMRVTARMGEPIVYKEDGIHFDGILARGAFLDLLPEERAAMPPIDAVDFPLDIDMPLSRWSVAPTVDADRRLLAPRSELGGHGDELRLWGWVASCASDDAWFGRGKLEVRKKPALGAMGRYTGDKSANLSAGHMKAYDLALPTVLALEVTWYAFGDPAEVQRLLSEHVPAIGAKRNIGSGRVLAWHVEPIAGDALSVIVGDGRALRRLPAGAAKGSPGRGTIRPPYYHPTRAVVSVGP